MKIRVVATQSPAVVVVVAATRNRRQTVTPPRLSASDSSHNANWRPGRVVPAMPSLAAVHVHADRSNYSGTAVVIAQRKFFHLLVCTHAHTHAKDVGTHRLLFIGLCSRRGARLEWRRRPGGSTRTARSGRCLLSTVVCRRRRLGRRRRSACSTSCRGRPSAGRCSCGVKGDRAGPPPGAHAVARSGQTNRGARRSPPSSLQPASRLSGDRVSNSSSNNNNDQSMIQQDARAIK
jgi:hypothetical protein